MTPADKLIALAEEMDARPATAKALKVAREALKAIGHKSGCYSECDTCKALAEIDRIAAEALDGR